MRTDRQTDMTKLTVAFRDFAKAPKNQNPRQVITIISSLEEGKNIFNPNATRKGE
jgi:hypothetical protein